MVGPYFFDYILVSLQNKSRRSRKHIIHLSVHVFGSDLSDRILEFQQFNAFITLKLNSID